MFYWEYLLFMLPAMIIAVWAQISVSSTFKKYSALPNINGMTGAQAARIILDSNGLGDVRIEKVPGNLTDHFDPRSNVIRLSDSVYSAPTSAAVGVAAHEAGHAVQYATGYGPIKLRAAILPVCQIGSGIAPYLLLIGIIFNFEPLFLLGIISFCLVALFQLVTLPVEFNASRRAISALESSRSLNGEELYGARKVLTAAAMTYVAALFTTFMQIFYYISRYRRSN